MNEELFNEASKSNILSKQLVDQLQESMTYSSISFINWTIEVLKLLKARIERGDKIKDETTGVIYDLYTFRQFVETNFSTYITGQVFNTSIGVPESLLHPGSLPRRLQPPHGRLRQRKNLPLDLQLKQTLLPGRNDRHRNRLRQRQPYRHLPAIYLRKRQILQIQQRPGKTHRALTKTGNPQPQIPRFSHPSSAAPMTHSPLQATGNLSLSSQPSSAAPMAHPTPVIPQGISAFPPSRPAQR